MKGHFKVVLKDSSGTVKKTVETDAILTNAYKYLSTWGYPMISRTNVINWHCWSLNMSMSGIIGFNDVLSTNPDDFRYDLDFHKTCYANFYTQEYSQYSSKVGMQGTPDVEHPSPYAFNKKFTWSGTQGNGIIKSLCITHNAGAGAFDTEPPKDVTNAYTMGNDGSTIYYPTGSPGRNYPLMSYSNGWVYPMSYRPAPRNGNTWYGSDGDESFIFFYQTDTNIVMLRAKSESVTGGYKMTIKYKIIDKDQMYRWNGFTVGWNINTAGYNWCYHKLTAHSFDWDDWEGELTINSAYPLVSMYTGNTGQSSYYDRQLNYNDDEFHLCFSYAPYIVFGEQGEYLSSSPTPNPTAEAGTSSRYSWHTYIIGGEAPHIITPPDYESTGKLYFNSTYPSPLYYFGNSFGSGSYTTGICLMPDYTYVYKWYNSRNGEAFIVRRSFHNDTLIWRKSVPNCDAIMYLQPDTIARNKYVIFPYHMLGTSTYYEPGANNSGAYAAVMDVNTGEIKGYTMLFPRIPYAYKNLLYPKDNNMFSLATYVAQGSTMDGYISVLSTNYMYFKANLPEEIVKEEGDTLEITVTYEL